MPGGVKPLPVQRTLPVQQVLTIIDDLPFESRELAYRPRRRVTCFSPWSALGLPHDAIREEMVSTYLATRGSSDDGRLPNLRLHQIHRPGDGTSRSKGPQSAHLLSNSSSSCRDCLEGHGGISCVAETSGHTPQSRAAGTARCKGVDSEERAQRSAVP